MTYWHSHHYIHQTPYSFGFTSAMPFDCFICWSWVGSCMAPVHWTPSHFIFIPASLLSFCLMRSNSPLVFDHLVFRRIMRWGWSQAKRLSPAPLRQLSTALLVGVCAPVLPSVWDLSHTALTRAGWNDVRKLCYAVSSIFVWSFTRHCSQQRTNYFPDSFTQLSTSE